MTIDEIKAKIAGPEYAFLREHEYLGDNICLMGLGGSYSYGTNTDTSDLDVRGIYLNSPEEILTGEYSEQFIDVTTDTTIYSFRKMIALLSSCNPNTIELLGLKDEQYLIKTEIGQELLDNRRIFLSKKAVQSFGGYAMAQLRRLDNKASRVLNQSEREQHILNSIKNASYDFRRRYFEYDDDAIKLYIDKAIQQDYDTEIFMDINLTHYPLRDYKSMMSEMTNIIRDYSKIGKRNSHAIQHDKLGKHMMHLIRLYMMCIDILKEQEIITYREAEHDLLMEIRNGRFLDENSQPIREFYDILDEYEEKLNEAARITTLPDLPDYDKIREFVIMVNKKVIG